MSGTPPCARESKPLSPSSAGDRRARRGPSASGPRVYPYVVALVALRCCCCCCCTPHGHRPVVQHRPRAHHQSSPVLFTLLARSSRPSSSSYSSSVRLRIIADRVARHCSLPCRRNRAERPNYRTARRGKANRQIINLRLLRVNESCWCLRVNE